MDDAQASEALPTFTQLNFRVFAVFEPSTPQPSVFSALALSLFLRSLIPTNLSLYLSLSLATLVPPHSRTFPP